MSAFRYRRSLGVEKPGFFGGYQSLRVLRVKETRFLGGSLSWQRGRYLVAIAPTGFLIYIHGHRFSHISIVYTIKGILGIVNSFEKKN